jgi:hypothetical protein
VTFWITVAIFIIDWLLYLGNAKKEMAMQLAFFVS